MTLPHALRWMLALVWVTPTALAAQSHGLAPNQRVRIRYHRFGGSYEVEARVRSLTDDSVGLTLPDASLRTIAWSNVDGASVWDVGPPRRYSIGLVGGLGGALLGGFAELGGSGNSTLQSSVLAGKVVKGALLGAAAGVLVGVGVSYLTRPHLWRPVDIHAGSGAGGPPSVSISISLPVPGR